MPRPPGSVISIGIALLCTVTLVSTLGAVPTRKRTFTGEIDDTMCGRKHVNEPAADCAHACVAHGSKYALMVGEKMYTLQTGDKAVLAALHQHAGRTVTITGTSNGDTIRVNSVVPVHD